MLHLVIGNRNYSSWSLRAWLYLRESGINFEETRLSLFADGWQEAVRRYSETARVPVLIDGDVSVWDSLAIIEHARENHGGIDWPAEQRRRANARSISAEMHSGFLAVRDELPMNVRASTPIPFEKLSESCQQQVKRIDEIWTSQLGKHDGDYLFGDFGIADVMFAPVTFRFSSYDIPVSEASQNYIRAVQGRPSMKEWATLAAAEEESLDFIDNLVPAADSELTLG